MKPKRLNGRRYSEDAITRYGLLYEDPRVPLEAIEATGVPAGTLFRWARERGWKRPECQRVTPPGLKTLEGARKLIQAAGVEFIETAREKRVDAPPAVSPAMLTAGVKALSIAEGFAEAQPGGGAALIVYVAGGDLKRLEAAAAQLGVDRDALVRAYTGAGPQTLVVEGEKL